jgi:flagellar motor protein MotB
MTKAKGNAMRKGPGGDLKQLQNQPPAEPPAHELAASMEYLTKELETEIREGKVKLSLEPRGLVVSLVQAAYFPSGEDRIYPETYPSIEKVAAVIRKLPNQVRIEGHTDSVPIHNSRFRSNWELSAARSIRMLELLAGRFGVPRERLAIAGLRRQCAGRAQRHRGGPGQEPPRGSGHPHRAGVDHRACGPIADGFPGCGQRTALS